MKPRILFIDRDGTLIKENAAEQIDTIHTLEFVPGMLHHLRQIAALTDYHLVMVTNQDGLGTPTNSFEKFWPLHNLILQTLEGEGIHFEAIHIDHHYPADNAPTRKPGTGMLTRYMDGTWNLAESYVIGDRDTDAQLARNLGCRALILDNPAHTLQPQPRPTDGEIQDYEQVSPWAAEPDVMDAPQWSQHPYAADDAVTYVRSWSEIADRIIGGPRVAEQHRVTHETDILIRLNLDGHGQADIHTGLGFFDHMLEQIARHGGVDLTVQVKGDLHVDEHHTIEDTGIVLGECLAQALGNKRGLARYGFSLPMDDCLASAALDFGGRPWLVWQAEFHRERIGEMPTEMFLHFFKSLSDGARMNLNIQAEGDNEHHKIEGIFKAFARALRMAKRRDIQDQQLPSSKGLL